MNDVILGWQGQRAWNRKANGRTQAKELEDRVLAKDKDGEGEGKGRRHGGAGRMILL